MWFAYGSRFRRSLMFTDEKKLSCDGVDEPKCFWIELRKERLMLPKQTGGGESTTIRGAIIIYGALNLAGIMRNMKSVQYCRIFGDALTEPAAAYFGKGWIPLQDNAPVHTSQYSKFLEYI